MDVLVALLGIVLGALAGGVVTHLTTRSKMRLELEYASDRTLQERRLERYQELFHLTECVPRAWRPGKEPTGADFDEFRERFHRWYFGEKAGGMFLTAPAKDLYMRLQDTLEEAAVGPAATGEMLRLASELRHQMTEDVGAAHPPRLRGARPGPTPPSPRRTNRRPGRPPDPGDGRGDPGPPRL
ncbi:hypothetical protein [Couchioplanes azureus]|uniref:hypothetical protein n=1 Tax=Couchioplanes caeruleus TaxID=56438 RepID=UPI00166F990F|nr:hypothetical protein [Couchioplanes caeruleus]GGQ70103.1 hypothetical protein GCM10010166_44930 [Couchioplanes caeruleus subsp. azureus]